MLIGISYAYISYTNRQVGINVIETDCINVTMEELTNAINLKNTHPVTDEVGESLKPFRFKLTNTCGVGVDYNINLEVMETNNRIASSNIATKVDELEKSILSSNATAPITYQESDYTGVEAYTINSGSIKPYESITHEIRIWLDESAGNDSQNGTFYSKVVIDARQNQNTMAKFSDYIIEQVEEDASIEEFEHVATHQTPALTDYRYVGKNPNNYVCFGSKESVCPEDNLYRIIGVIPTQELIDGEYENKVKLIKKEYYIKSAEKGATNSPAGGTGYGYRWNNIASNKWENSNLKNILNNEYLNDFEEYKNYILASVWYLGAFSGTNTDQFYSSERGSTQATPNGALSTKAYIGLMYSSDYGYSIGKQYREMTVNQNQNIYQNNSWLLPKQGYEWTISPLNYSTLTSVVVELNPDGRVNYPYCEAQNCIYGIRPTFYLKSNVLYESGEGTQENPYRISINEQD